MLAVGALLVSQTSTSDAVIVLVTALGVVLVAIGSIFSSALRARRELVDLDGRDDAGAV